MAYKWNNHRKDNKEPLADISNILSSQMYHRNVMYISVYNAICQSLMVYFFQNWVMSQVTCAVNSSNLCCMTAEQTLHTENPSTEREHS